MPYTDEITVKWNTSRMKRINIHLSTSMAEKSGTLYFVAYFKTSERAEDNNNNNNTAATAAAKSWLFIQRMTFSNSLKWIFFNIIYSSLAAASAKEAASMLVSPLFTICQHILIL